MDNVGYGDIGIYGGGCCPARRRPTSTAWDRKACISFHLLPALLHPHAGTLLTGRLPMRNGVLRPSFAGEPGGLEDETTVARSPERCRLLYPGRRQVALRRKPGIAATKRRLRRFLRLSGLVRPVHRLAGRGFAARICLEPGAAGLVKAVGFNDHLVHAVKGQDVENLEEITIEVSAELDDKLATYSVDFIKKMAESDKPFFLYHCTRGAHVKNYPNPKFKGKSPAKYPYKDCIVEMDDIVGRLVKALEDTGQLENTLIFVTSDNGPMIEPWPDAGWYTLPRRHRWHLEGSMRSPAVVYWKDMITPGQSNDGLFDLADLFTTSLALAGVEYRAPEDQYMDGIDQTSFLLADAGLSNRKYVYYWLQDILTGVRVAEYKFMVAGMSDDDLGRGQSRQYHKSGDLQEWASCSTCTSIPRSGTASLAGKPLWTTSSVIPWKRTRLHSSSTRARKP